MDFSSRYLADAVEALASLPSIGRKTALRLALHLLKQAASATQRIADALRGLEKVGFCKRCHNISDGEFCEICMDNRRDKGLICVVEGIRDVMAIEETGQFRGQYHILGGVINPIEGVGPDVLNIDSLVGRVKAGDVREIIMAVSPTIEGDTTIFYLSKQLRGHSVTISTIARGVSFGSDLQYADELTLGRSIATRAEYRLEN